MRVRWAEIGGLTLAVLAICVVGWFFQAVADESISRLWLLGVWGSMVITFVICAIVGRVRHP